jgi:hypothetical protein
VLVEAGLDAGDLEGLEFVANSFHVYSQLLVELRLRLKP